MAEEWRNLGLAAMVALVAVGTRTSAPDFIASARQKLYVRIEVLRRLRAGVLPSEIDIFDIDDRAPTGACPTVFLQGAHRWVAQETALHATAGHLFALYVRAHPGLQGTQRLQDWRGRRDDAFQTGNAALEMVRLALARAQASLAAQRVAESSFPRLSAGWNAWMWVAQNLVHLARDDARAASHWVGEMQTAVRSQAACIWWMVMGGQG